MFGVKNDHPYDMLCHIQAMGKTGRQQAVKLNKRRADAAFHRVSQQKPKQIEDDGSQEWLDAYAEREWKRFFGAVLGRRKYADGDQRLELDAYCRKIGLPV
jgi:phage terminase small subunit